MGKKFGRKKTLLIFAIPIEKRRVGQSVKTPPFHGGMTGSTPVRATEKSLQINTLQAFILMQKILFFTNTITLKKPLIYLSFFICFAACSKTPSPTGHAQFQNSSDDTYQAIIDGNAKTIIQPHSDQIFDVSVGFHKLEAQQVSNTGLVAPITWDPYIPADQTALFIFP